MNRILIVEDDEFVSRMYARIFRASGFDVIVISDGKIAFDDLSTRKVVPSVILMDVMVPGMSGVDLLRHIKQEPHLKDIPIAVLTNSFVKENEKLFLSIGADLYLIKIENSPKDVVKKIEDLVQKKKLVSTI